MSLFSGVEAATIAWEPLGWEPMAFCEIDEFPSAVLAHRWPNVPNLGDITRVDWGEFVETYGRPDVVVGGSPCQSFSVAGGRESLGGESRLMFEYIRAVGDLKPLWFVWENVPGCLSTKDNAFGQLLREMEDVGYQDLCWRVLDAQFFGVAQRRRRVFLVGRFGAGGGYASAAVLLEPDCLRGDTPSSREKRKELAEAARESVGGADGTYGIYRDTTPKVADGVSPTLRVGGEGGSNLAAMTNYGSRQSAVAFAQNQRDEVRLLNGDGQVIGALSSSQFGTHKQETLLCMADDTQNAAIDDDLSGSLKVGGGTPFIAMSRA